MQLNWPNLIMVLGALLPLFGLPLTVITFYLKDLRNTQLARYEELLSRFNGLDSLTREVSRSVGRFQREYTTRQEWSRESTSVRKQLNDLAHMIARVEAQLGNGHNVATRLGDATQALLELTKLIARNPASADMSRQLNPPPFQGGDGGG